MKKQLFRSAQAALAISLGLALAGCNAGGPMGVNRSLESVHQPVVAHTNYTLDLTTGPGGLSLPEQRRLTGWFEAMDLHYGDRISIDDPLASGATRTAVEAVAARYGLLVTDDAPTTPGAVGAGTARIIITRASASVPGCPDWTTSFDANFENATASGFGCAINGNLAGMVADPEDLLRGATNHGNTVVMTGTKAIETYREAEPTGKNGLKENSTQSGR